MSSSASKIELRAYDDLFETDESRAEAKLAKIRDRIHLKVNAQIGLSERGKPGTQSDCALRSGAKETDNRKRIPSELCFIRVRAAAQYR